MPPRLHEAFRMVSDIDASVAFYEALGLPVVEHTDQRAELDAGPVPLSLEQDFDEATLAEYGLPVPGSDRGTGAILILEVDDVEAAHDRAVEAGAETLREPMTAEWGEELCLVTDPDGYVVELVTPLEE